MCTTSFLFMCSENEYEGNAATPNNDGNKTTI